MTFALLIIRHARIRRLVNFDGVKFRRAAKNFRRRQSLKNFPCKIFRRGIFVRESLQLVQKSMVEVVKDFVKLRLENFEVDEHSEPVQLLTANNRLNCPIMTVQTRTFAVVAADEMRRLERRTNRYLVQNFQSFLYMEIVSASRLREENFQRLVVRTFAQIRAD